MLITLMISLHKILVDTHLHNPSENVKVCTRTMLQADEYVYYFFPELELTKHRTQSKSSIIPEPAKLAVRQNSIQDEEHRKKGQSSPTDAPPPADSTYEPGIDVCDSVDLSAVAPSRPDNSYEELREYTEEEVARYEARRHQEVEGTPQTNGSSSGRIEVKPETARLLSNSEPRSSEEQIRQLRETQNRLKTELEAAKTRLMIDKSRWSYECKK